MEKMPKIWRTKEYELLDPHRTSSESSQLRSSSDLDRDFDFDFDNDTSQRFEARSVSPSYPPLKFWSLRLAIQRLTRLRRGRNPRKRRRQCRYWIAWTLASIPWILVFLVYFTAIFVPSYTHGPEHYRILERRCKASKEPGRGNPNNEKVMIAASIYDHDGKVLAGQWGSAVVELVNLLGPENVHLSVYENDPNDAAKASLTKLGGQLKSSNLSLVSEHLPLEDIPRITIPSGERQIKRIAFLADVRNRALRPLDESTVQFDKLIFINDVLFDPIEAVQLLFSTNIDANGRTQYGAVCAVDFINAFKFYDYFATRDFEGNGMGLQFFPWFADAGDAISRKDAIAQKDAVRVRSCWGGMTAFEASWFQKPAVNTPSTRMEAAERFPNLPLSPLRFRYEEDPFWEASECCLIHADLTYLRHRLNTTTDTGIYMNPYVRTAYDPKTFSWLAWTRRPERLFSLIHGIVSKIGGMPSHNPRRLEQPGDEVIEKVWKYDVLNPSKTGVPRGSYYDVKKTAAPGRFCGKRQLQVLNEGARKDEDNWRNIELPLPPP